MRSPVTNQARARDSPTLRTRYGEMTAGITPSLTSVVPKIAFSAATTTSHTARRPVQLVERPEERGELGRVAAILLHREARDLLHPVDVGAGAEDLARARQLDDAGRRIAGQLAHRMLELRHELAVEGVPAGRAVEDEARDPRIGRAFEQDAGLAHRNTSTDPGRSRGTMRIWSRPTRTETRAMSRPATLLPPATALPRADRRSALDALIGSSTAFSRPG